MDAESKWTRSRTFALKLYSIEDKHSPKCSAYLNTRTDTSRFTKPTLSAKPLKCAENAVGCQRLNRSSPDSFRHRRPDPYPPVRTIHTYPGLLSHPTGRRSFTEPRTHEQKNSKPSNEQMRYVKQTKILTHAAHINRWEPAVYMSCMGQNFRLFHVPNLSVRNLRIVLLMYPG